MTYGETRGACSQSSLGGAPTDGRVYGLIQALDLLALTQTAAQATDLEHNVSITNHEQCSRMSAVFTLGATACYSAILHNHYTLYTSY